MVAIICYFMGGIRMDNLYREAGRAVEAAAMKESAEDVKVAIPAIVDLVMTTYKEGLKRGLDDDRAFKFAVEFILRAMFGGAQ